MSAEPTIEQAANTQTPDPITAFLGLKLRKKGPLVELKKADEGVPVYFLHELTGDVSCYHRIAEVIEAPVFGIQVPQAERRRGAISTIGALAARYVELIVKNHPQGPIRLVGWSGGALIALEVASQLTSIGRQPQILVNIDQAVDNAKGIVSPCHSFLENLYYWMRNEPKWPLAKFGGRLIGKFTETIMTLAGRPPPRPVHDPKNAVKARPPEEVDFIREFYELLFAYIPPRSYSGRVLSLVASENWNPDRLIRSWKSIARDSQFIFVSGDHEALVTGPSVLEVREHIRKTFSDLATT